MSTNRRTRRALGHYSRPTRRMPIAASAIVNHVRLGDWLGASWPQYVKGLPKGMSPGELGRAFELAEQRFLDRIGLDLTSESRCNFEREAHLVKAMS